MSRFISKMSNEFLRNFAFKTVAEVLGESGYLSAIEQVTETQRSVWWKFWEKPATTIRQKELSERLPVYTQKPKPGHFHWEAKIIAPHDCFLVKLAYREKKDGPILVEMDLSKPQQLSKGQVFPVTMDLVGWVD